MRSATISCFLAVQLALTAPAQNPPTEKLAIVVIEGEGAIRELCDGFDIDVSVAAHLHDYSR